MVLVRTRLAKAILTSTHNLKNNVYSCKPKFYFIKVGFSCVCVCGGGGGGGGGRGQTYIGMLS